MRNTLALMLLALSACSGWKPVARYERWTLFEQPDQVVPAERFAAAFEPAFLAVEAALGPFEGHVAVHAWNERLQAGGHAGHRHHPGRADHEAGTGVHQVDGIGPARIQAYHTRGGTAFDRNGVFICTPDAGTAVHELVHARFTELGVDLPLWLEEGIACVLGDGILVDGTWAVDGLACWPLRELREEQLTDADLERLLSLDSTDQPSVRDNVLVHFIGWAIVFDLARESGGEILWQEWLADLGEAQPPRARYHLDRTLHEVTALDWLSRLQSPSRQVRLTTAKGLWKLRSQDVLEALLAALEVEEDTEVRVCLAVNALAASGDLGLSWRQWLVVEEAVQAALRTAELQDPEEQQAVLDLYGAYRNGADRQTAQAALRRLDRFWEE